MGRTPGARTRSLDEKLAAVRQVRSGAAQAEVARDHGVHPSTVSRWCRRAREGGLNALARRPVSGRPPKLPPSARKRLQVRLRSPPDGTGDAAEGWTLAKVAALIQREFGVDYHPGHLSRLLRALRIRV